MNETGGQGEAAGREELLPCGHPKSALRGDVSTRFETDRTWCEMCETEAAGREELPERCEHGFRPPDLPCPFCGKDETAEQEAAGRLVTREEAEALVDAFHIKPNALKVRLVLRLLYDRIAQLEKALRDYNSALRSAAAVCSRQGADTNWDTFSKRVFSVLEEHHKTWVETFETEGKRAWSTKKAEP